MADTSISLNFSGIPSTVQELHIHIEYATELVTAITRVEAKVSAVGDAVVTVKTEVDGLLADNVELIKDVNRLIADGNTAEAVTTLNNMTTNLQSARSALANLDAAVETADPEPVPAPEPTPANPADELLG